MCPGLPYSDDDDDDDLNISHLSNPKHKLLMKANIRKFKKPSPKPVVFMHFSLGPIHKYKAKPNPITTTQTTKGSAPINTNIQARLISHVTECKRFS